MNFDKMSFRPSKTTRPYLEELCRRCHIDNPTELLQKLVDDHKDRNMGSRGADNIDEPEYESPGLQKNRNDCRMDSIRPQDEASPEGVDTDCVDNYPFGREAKQDVIPMQNSGDGFYVDDVHTRADWMSTNTGDIDVTNELQRLYHQQTMLQAQATMDLQYRIEQAKALATKYLQQTRSQLNMISMSYMPPFGYPVMHHPPMMYDMAHRSGLDFVDLITDTTEKMQRLKKAVQSSGIW